MQRRELIQWLAATASADLLAFGRAVHAQPLPRRSTSLSPEVERTITIAAERILPATDTPGATDANVTAFIEKVLADWHTPEERARFLAGVQELERRHFLDVTEADQLAILTELDDSKAEWFARLKYLTVYGYCTSEVGMRALGLWPLALRYDGCAPLNADH